MRVCFCSVNFRLLLFYWVNKLVKSYLLHIFIWLYIFLLGTEGERRQPRLRDTVNCSTHQDVWLCSDPFAKIVNITSYILSSRKFMTCGGRTCRNVVPLSSSLLLTLIRSCQHEDQIDVPKGRKSLGALRERNAVPHLVTLNKTHLSVLKEPPTLLIL